MKRESSQSAENLEAGAVSSGRKSLRNLEIAYYDKNLISRIAAAVGTGSPEYVQESAELSPRKGACLPMHLPDGTVPGNRWKIWSMRSQRKSDIWNWQRRSRA